MSEVKKLVMERIDGEWRSAHDLWRLCDCVWQNVSFKKQLMILSSEGLVDSRMVPFQGKERYEFRRKE